MPGPDKHFFENQAVIQAFEKYSAVTRLSVRIYGRDKSLIRTLGHNRLNELFGIRYEPRILIECVRRCFSPAEQTSKICGDHEHGIGVVAAPLMYAGEVVYVAVGAYALTSHLDQLQVRRLSKESGVSVEDLWVVIGNEVPLTRDRLDLNGQLLRILGETLLSEDNRGRELHEALARVESVNRAKDEFLAMLSHELRGPLTSILGWSEMLRTGTLDATDTSKALEMIERDAKVQNRLVNDLLDISRIVAGKLDLELQTVDLSATLITAVDSVRGAAESKGIILDVQQPDEPLSVNGDPDRLRQVFFNLLSNAVKFTPRGGAVTVRWQRTTSQAEITISDTGEGIARDVLPQIFERFRQADSSTTKRHSGLGLGLSIARHLVERHDGMIQAYSEGVGRGATFTVTLPLIERKEIENANERLGFAKSNPPDGHERFLNGIRVWVVDDKPSGRLLLKTLLEQRGAQVTALASAYEALGKLDESVPEVLVSDIGMPGMDGYALISEIRNRGAERGGTIPAVALSGYASPEEREKALAAGFQLHIAKPFNGIDLMRAIARLANTTNDGHSFSGGE
jgi:signal transduction histidine kinase/CheY-like chemotaxis protein